MVAYVVVAMNLFLLLVLTIESHRLARNFMSGSALSFINLKDRDAEMVLCKKQVQVPTVYCMLSSNNAVFIGNY